MTYMSGIGMVVEPYTGTTSVGILQMNVMFLAVTACCKSHLTWNDDEEAWWCPECDKVVPNPPSDDYQGESGVYLLDMPNLGVTFEDWTAFWLGVDSKNIEIEVER